MDAFTSYSWILGMLYRSAHNHVPWVYFLRISLLYIVQKNPTCSIQRKPCDRRGHPCQTLARGEEAKDESEGSWRGARRPRNNSKGGIEAAVFFSLRLVQRLKNIEQYWTYWSYCNCVALLFFVYHPCLSRNAIMEFDHIGTASDRKCNVCVFDWNILGHLLH